MAPNQFALPVALVLSAAPALAGSADPSVDSLSAADPNAAGPGVSLSHLFGLSEPAAGHEDGVVPELLSSIDLYGSLRASIVRQDGENEVANSASRIGINLRQPVGGSWAAVGTVEWGVNLVQSNTDLLLEGGSSAPILTESDSADTFTTRLGWIGFADETWGQFQLGKQWGPYYDVAGWTDRFYAFGATALGVFPAGTDGGDTGTGRADQALGWRGHFGPLVFGLQAQMQGTSAEGAESYGASLIWEVGEDLAVGAAYNQAKFSDDAQAAFADLDEASALVLGAHWTPGNLDVAACWATQDDNDVVILSPTTFDLFDATGAELYARYGFGEHWGVYGGFNVLEPTEVATPVDPDFDTQDYYLGVDYIFVEGTLLFVQVSVGEGTESDGSDASDSFVLGMRYGI